jgi:MOSC domain-containing protein YiiM
MDSSSRIQQLIHTLPQSGSVQWIGLRSQKKGNMHVVEQAYAIEGRGLDGDHYSGGSGKRGVTLIQAEHLPAVAAMLHVEQILPEQLRRNIVVSGINLLALKDRHIRIGDAELRVTGLCHPCSRMETVLGPGGYNAMRGHGGITARICKSGVISTGDAVSVSE